MQRKVICKIRPRRSYLNLKTLLAMKMLAFLLTVISIQLAARTNGQGISLSIKGAKIEQVFKAVEEQSVYRFVYSREAVAGAKPVSMQIKDGTLEHFLQLCFADQPLGYSIDGKYIIVKRMEVKEQVSNFLDLRGRVVNEQGEAMGGVTVSVKGTKVMTVTDSKGAFAFIGVSADGVIVVSGAEIESKEIQIFNQEFITIRVVQKLGLLDETVIIGYGTTTQRFSTGTITKVNADEISKQPVQNPLAALQGRVPGLIVTATSGVPGSAFKVQIRGQNSINSNPEQILINPIDQPLFIIDGVPFATQNENINQYLSIATGGGELYNNSYGGMSPFQSINPADIESIEVLRDADATAIYGSRAANGVILITTKKGIEGKTKFTLSTRTGISKVTRTMRMMNTEEYLLMRKEAFANDGIIPNSIPGTPGYAPDLTLFDSSRNVGWQKYFLGGNANDISINTALSGGNSTFQFIMGSGYSKESDIFPGDFGSQRGSFNLNVSYTSNRKNFFSELSANYSYTQNNVPGSINTLTAFKLPPNYPELLMQNGEINWEYNGIILDENPLGYLRQKYSSNNYNLIARFQTGIEIFSGLSLRSSFGYNTLNSKESLQIPKSSFSPGSNKISMASFGNNDFKTYIIEPQLEYKKKIGHGKINVLAGGTYQQNTNYSVSLVGSNYSNDALMGSIAGAVNKSVSDSYNQYKYAGLFGRINYTLMNKYIINLNGRRDGSSRFGPGKQFGNFGSIGLGWLFSEEEWIKKHFKFISYGKMRSSFGTTGNDAIGNYQYLSRWGISLFPYQSVIGYNPQNLYNPNFGWSETRKLDLALELGILNNRIISTIGYYRSRSGNQLAIYNLPFQTGFSGVLGNFPALVQNSGIEVSINTINIKNKSFQWKSNINFSSGKNKLLAFPGIESSSYVYEYIVGQSLSVLNKFIAIGLNPSTGVYEFESVNGPTVNPVSFRDYKVAGDLTPVFTGGVGNTANYKNFEFDIFIQFVKQIGPNYLGQVYQTVPGTYGNQPSILLQRWQKLGDNSEIQRFTSSQNSIAANVGKKIRNSSVAFSDASFARLKNCSISYKLNKNLINKLKIESCRFYINTQNLFTLTSYKGNDPETMSFYSLPPLKTITGGFQITL